MTPDELAKKTEHGHQAALFAWANQAARYGFEHAANDLSYDYRTRGSLWERPYEIPALNLLFAIHNQGHGDKIRGGRAKAEGVKAGVPDTMLPVPLGGYHGLFIELKLPKYKTAKDGGRSEKQDKWIASLQDAGYCVCVAYGWKEAAQIITEYLKGA